MITLEKPIFLCFSMFTPLQEGHEFETLRTLSEGLVGLIEENDFVFVDTSLLFKGIKSFDVNYLEWVRMFSHRMTGREVERFNLRTLIKVNIAYEGGFLSPDDLDDIYCVIGDDLLRAKFTLSVLAEVESFLS